MALKILYMSALPRDQHSIPVEGEYKAILDVIAKSEYKNQIDVRDWPGVSLTEFQSAIETYKPNVLHFSGHASQVGDLVFQGPEEESQKVPKDPFTNAFKLLGENLKLVVLSACYSKDQAEDVSKHVDRVIGIDKEIEGDKAVMFSEKFYESIFDSDAKSIEKAFDIAKNELDMNTKEWESVPTPVLLKSPSRDPSPLFLIETPTRRLNKYLNYIINEASDLVERSSDDIKVKYIEEREAVLLDVNNEWSSDDIKIRNEHTEITDFDTQLNRFLESESDRLLFLAAPFGVGKSVLARKIASEYAFKCQKKNDEYVPVFVPLRNGLNNVYRGSLYDLLDNVVTYAKHDRKILLILDSLDEYEHEKRGDLKELNLKIRNELLPKYSKMKIIVTSRLNIDYPKTFEIRGQKYLRLLSFSDEQVNQFFEINSSGLTYKDALSYGLEHKDIAKPLLSFMLLKVFPFIGSDLKQKHQHFTSNMFRSFIYFHFLSHLTEGKRIEKEDRFQINNSYLDEKNALRKLALLKQIHKDGLTKQIIENEAKFFGFKSDVLHINPVLTCYLYSNSPSDENEIHVNFIHESFQEYLMAENYLEALLKGENKSAWMNAGKPSKETINFLDGLLHLLMSDDGNIKKYVEHNDEKQISLFNLFDYNELIDDAIYNIVNNAIENLNDENVMVFNPAHMEQVPWIKAEEQITVNEYPSLWIHRWISLYVLYKLGYLNRSNVLQKLGLDKVPDTKKLKSLLKFSRLFRVCSDAVLPNFRSLRGFDLSGINLSGADLSGADLCGANLSGADLSGANLKDAILSSSEDSCKTNLSNSDLSNANLFRTDLSGADLSGAKLLRADLSGANLSRTKLIGANISDANISDATICGADLSGADLYRANLCDARLIEATLTECKLAYANFAYANLSGAKLQGANLLYANLSDSNLNSANLSGAKLQGANLSYANLYKAKFDNIDKDLSEAHTVGANFANTVITNIPADGEENVSNSSPIMIFFNESIDLENLTFNLNKEGCSDAEGKISVSEDGKIVTFISLQNLCLSTKYFASVKYSSGNEKIWSFTITPITTGKILSYSILKGSGHDGNVFDNVRDSNLNTRWSNYGKGSYLILDLGSLENIGALDIAWFKGNKRQYFFEISLSIDGKDFPSIAYDGMSAGKALAPQRYKLKSEFKARYVKIQVDGNTQNNWASITEIRLYGEDSTVNTSTS
jgi:uncharacterized protein YjbI with pentapeptide repeats